MQKVQLAIHWSDISVVKPKLRSFDVFHEARMSHCYMFNIVFASGMCYSTVDMPNNVTGKQREVEINKHIQNSR